MGIFFSKNNLDFRKYMDKDVHLRKSYSQLRRMAIVLFSCSVLTLATSIADIEYSIKARELVATGLQCNDTYVIGLFRYLVINYSGIWLQNYIYFHSVIVLLQFIHCSDLVTAYRWTTRPNI